ncbi:hypothetical protein BZA77DRAFT_323149 [Pyronema omphalodes]|nr:hypothetical protein BZA77DRAFT_323149 [Pyronema omphalodes]
MDANSTNRIEANGLRLTPTAILRTLPEMQYSILLLPLSSRGYGYPLRQKNVKTYRLQHTGDVQHLPRTQLDGVEHNSVLITRLSYITPDPISYQSQQRKPLQCQTNLVPQPPSPMKKQQLQCPPTFRHFSPGYPIASSRFQPHSQLKYVLHHVPSSVISFSSNNPKSSSMNSITHSTLNVHAPIFVAAAAAGLSGRKPLNPRATVFLPAGTSKGYIRGPKRLNAEATIFTPTAAIATEHASTSFSSELAHQLSPTVKEFMPRVHHQGLNDYISNLPPALGLTGPHLLMPPSPAPQKFIRLTTSLPFTCPFYQHGNLFVCLFLSLCCTFTSLLCASLFGLG